MSEQPTSLDHAAALRAAAGFTDVGDDVDAAGRELRDAVDAVGWGDDAVGAALASRHAARAAELVDALAALAQRLRGLHTGVVTAAAGLTATDADAAGDLDRDRG